MGVALLVGVPLGMVSGYFGGAVDRLMVLLMDTLYTLPVLLLSVVLAFLLGKGIPMPPPPCVVYVPQYFRVVRNQTAQVKSELFVEAAQSLGAGPLWILRRYFPQRDHPCGAAHPQCRRCGAGAGGVGIPGIGIAGDRPRMGW